MATCSSCHAHFGPQDRFCTGCGATVSSGSNTALIAGLVALLAVVVVGGVAAVLLLGNASGDAPVAAGKATSTAQAPPTRTVVTVIERPHRSATSNTGTATALPIRPYATSRYRLDVPATWTQVADDEDHSGVYRESRWNSPMGDAYLLIDYTVGFDGSAKSGADPLRSAQQGTSGYHEWAYRSWLGDRFWRWEFSKDGVRKVDFFAASCGTGYALLGAAPPDRFARLLPSFEAAARSLRLTC